MKFGKQVLALILTVVMLISCASVAFAEDTSTSGKCGENVAWTYNKSSGEMVISGTGDMYDYNGFPPYKQLGIKKVKIDNGVTSVGDRAFWTFDEMTVISIPESVTRIGYAGIGDCRALKEIIIPQNVTSIGTLAFAGCTSLTSLTIPEKVTEIGEEFILGDVNLENINTSAENLNYSSVNGVLYNKEKTSLICCPVKKDSVTIPNSVDNIYEHAFSGCTELRTIKIPDSVTSIKVNVFYDCSNLTEIKLPSSLKSIGYGSFADCSSLESIVLPESLEYVEAYAFSGCTSLRSIVLPDNVLSLSTYAFQECANLTNVSIGKNLSFYNPSVFNGCTRLTAIDVDAENPNFCSIEGVLYNKDITTLIECPEGKTNVSIPESVTEIKRLSFHNKNLNYIIMPRSIEKVEGGAFFWCDSIKDVYYNGTQQQWNAIQIDTGNDPLTKAKIHFNSTGPSTDPVTQPSTDPVTQPSTDPVTQPSTDPVTQPSTDPVTQPSTDPVTQPSTDPATNPSQEPTGEEPAQPDSDHVHDRTVVKIPATFDEDGDEEIYCEECGYTFSYRTFPAIASVKLSKTKYTYDGKQKKPKVVVLDREDNELEEGKDYTVKYSSGRKKVGKYNVRVTFQGNYEGTKKLSFKVVPGKVSGLKATAGKKFAQLKWNAVKGATNYVVYFATKKNGTFKKAFTTRGATAKVMKLKSGKTYYFRVRAVAKLDSGTFNGSLSAIKKAKIK